MSKEEERIRQRLAKIEYELLKCDDLIKIWELKKEHQEKSRLLKRLIRKR